MKKTTVLAAILLGGGIVFAQTSLTSTSTAGVFGTAVDDYNDVNNWQSVNEELDNLFAFTDFYSSTLSLGAAHRFGDIYSSLYFGGYFPSISSTSGETGGENTESFAMGHSFSMSALVGFNNIGIKLGGYVSPSVTNSTEGDVVTESDKSIYNLYASAGVNFGSIKPYATIGYYWRKQSGKSDTGTVVLETRSGYDFLNMELGTTFELEPTEKTESSFAVAISDELYFYPKNLVVVDGIVTDKQDKSGDDLALSASYKITYNAEGGLSAGLEAGLPIEMSFGSEKETDASEFSIGLSPELNIGLQYAASEKMTFNAGTSLTFNNLFNFTNTKEGDDTSKTTTAFKSLSLSASMGLHYAFTPKVALDTSLTALTGTSGIVNLGNIQLGLQMSVKL